MNEQKIEFIITYNNKKYLEECLCYIKKLKIPDGCEVNVTSIADAASMTEAYQEAMVHSDAKYKIYLHQDTFSINRDMLVELLCLFRKYPEVGMIGVLGSTKQRADGIMWSAWDCGRTRAWNVEKEIEIDLQGNEMSDIIQVQAIDGMFMATQYDIPWRNELSLGWDYYDISQSCEFLKAGYKIGVAYQKKPWCLHDCGHSKLKDYDSARRVFCEAYQEQGYQFTSEPVLAALPEKYRLFESAMQIVEKLVVQKDFNMLHTVIESLKALGVSYTDIDILEQMLEIRRLEQSEGTEWFWHETATFRDAVEKYTRLKFMLRRLEYGMEGTLPEDMPLVTKQYLAGHCIMDNVNYI